MEEQDERLTSRVASESSALLRAFCASTEGPTTGADSACSSGASLTASSVSTEVGSARRSDRESEIEPCASRACSTTSWSVSVEGKSPAMPARGV